MAELLTTGGWVGAGSLAAYLSEMLSNEYIVVADPIVRGCEYDAVVVGPRGLVALQAANGNLADTPALRTNGKAHDGPGPLKAFVQDEFPQLHPALRHLAAVRDLSADLLLWNVTGADAMTAGSVIEAITSVDQSLDPALTDEEVREDLAVALRDHQLTASQRASSPFVFRSSGWLGTRTEAWTLREIAAYMDRHPQDGIYHLCNGTLGQWLREQGAPHLAKLAQEAVYAGKNDRRSALETFLVGSGLVPRPCLVTQPKRLDLGYMLDGTWASGTLWIRRGRGRGYLFGHLATNVPWLSVEPREFAGDATEVVVVADTSQLLIGPEPYVEAVLVDSSASAQPISVPVQLRVVPMPSRFSRYALRPLLALLMAGVLGSLIGWLTVLVGGSIYGLRALGPLSPAALSIGLAAVLWAVLGLIRGMLQPKAWPIHYAAYRWLRRTLKWGLALAAAGLLAAWGWSRGGIDVRAAPALPYTLAALSGLVAAVLPATIGEIQSARALIDTSPRTRGRRAAHSALRLGLGLAALVILLAAPRFVLTAVHSPDVRERFGSALAWVEAGWGKLNDGADDLTNQFYLRYSDRRAPEPPTGGEMPGSALHLPEIKLP